MPRFPPSCIFTRKADTATVCAAPFFPSPLGRNQSRHGCTPFACCPRPSLYNRSMLLAVLTVSDRCSQRLAIDASGPAVAAFLRRTWPDAEIHTALVPDEIAEIGDRL